MKEYNNNIVLAQITQCASNKFIREMRIDKMVSHQNTGHSCMVSHQNTVSNDAYSAMSKKLCSPV